MNTLKKCFFSLLIAFPISGSLHAQEQEALLLTLDDALKIAMSENPTVKIAEKNIEKQQYVKDEAWGNLMPTIDAVGTYERSIKKMKMSFEGQTVTIGTDNSYNGGISAAMPLINMTLIKSIQLSEINIRLALEASRESKINLKNEVEKAFYQVLLTKDVHNVLQKSMDNAEENYTDVKNKYDQGLVAEYDLIRAEVQVSNLKPNLIEAKNNVRLSEFQLKLLMGLSVEEKIETVGSLVDYESEYELYAQLLDYNLNENSSIKQLDIQDQLLNKQLEMQKTAYLPTLSLSFTYGYMTMSNDFRFNHYNWYPTSTMGLTLRIPIFSGFTRKHKVSQLKTDIEALRYQRQYAEDGLKIQAKNTLINMQQAIEQLESNKTGIRSAEKAYSISQARYKSGMGTLLELNDSEVALTQARLNYNQSIYNYMVAKSNYDLLIGKE